VYFPSQCKYYYQGSLTYTINLNHHVGIVFMVLTNSVNFKIDMMALHFQIYTCGSYDVGTAQTLNIILYLPPPFLGIA
jgi:hypothetical protein